MTPGPRSPACVEGDLGRRPGLGRLPAEAVGAPERLVVDHERLRLGAGDRLAVQRGPVLGQHRIEGDVQHQRGRDGDHGVAAATDHVRVDDDVIVALARSTGPARSSCTASPSSSAIRCAIEPAPPSTMFSCEPSSIENSVLMLPCARTRNSRCSNDTSFRSPVISPRTAVSNRSRAMVVRMPECSTHPPPIASPTRRRGSRPTARRSGPAWPCGRSASGPARSWPRRVG